MGFMSQWLQGGGGAGRAGLPDEREQPVRSAMGVYVPVWCTGPSGSAQLPMF